MTILEYAKSKGISLNSAQLVILQEYEKGNKFIYNYPARQGRQILFDLIKEFEEYKKNEACKPKVLISGIGMKNEIKNLLNLSEENNNEN